MAFTNPSERTIVIEDLIGEQLGGRYRVTERLGRGGMAVVFRARDEHLDREVALKVFHRGSTTAQDLRRQRAEVRHFAGLTHPNLVTLYDAISDPDGRTALVLEYVRGTDLRARLADGPLPPASVAAVGRDIAQGLAHIHGRQVVHRDVSPGNILLPDAPHGDVGVAAKLTDLGIATVIDSTQITAADTVIGTAAYLSPEQVEGGRVSPASDIYSLGLVLLESLTGRREFEGRPTEAALARLSRDPVIPEHLAPEWRTLITSMTARDPGDRPAAAAAAEALRAVGSGADAAATQELRPASDQVADPQSTQVLSAAWMEETRPFSVAAGSRASRGSSRLRALLASAPPHQLFIAVGVALFLLVAIAGMVGTPPARSASNQPPAVPAYPTIPGQLGVHLKQLEHDVSPSVNQ